VQQYLTIWDLVLTPIYLLVLGYIAKGYRDKKYPKGHPLRPYYLPGVWVKFGGAIFIAVVYQFYYGDGDTFNFYYHSKIINSSLSDSFDTWVKLLFRTSPSQDPFLYPYTSQLYWYKSPQDYLPGAIGAVFGLFNFTTYMPIALLFAFFSYTGIWAMYKTFADLYPKIVKPLAFAFLFIPSIFVWGSGIFKDTICMFGLGWLTYTTFRIFINKDFSAKNILMLIISFYVIAIVKLYILLAFLPALILWLLLTYSHRIQTVSLRWLTNILVIGIVIGGFSYFSGEFSEDLNKYSLEKISRTSNMTREWIVYASGDEGSAYDLGDIEPGIGGMLSKFFPGVVVTLFRPFLWEVQKPIVALSALEGFVFLYLTLSLFFKHWRNIRAIFKDPNVVFCLVFALIFAFAVGISSGNFGALSRYKIPCMPFFGAFLVIMLNKNKKPVKKGNRYNKHQHTPLSTLANPA